MSAWIHTHHLWWHYFLTYLGKKNTLKWAALEELMESHKKMCPHISCNSMVATWKITNTFMHAITRPSKLFFVCTYLVMSAQLELTYFNSMLSEKVSCQRAYYQFCQLTSSSFTMATISYWNETCSSPCFFLFFFGFIFLTLLGWPYTI